MAEGNDSTVLVVDDDRAILEVVSEALTDSGYEVVTARDGVEALERVERGRPSLIILDLMMPRLDGFEVLERLFSDAGRAAGLPVIVLSARTGQADITQAIDRGAADFLTKPFDLDELIVRVRLHLARSSRQHASAEAAPVDHSRLEIHALGGLRVVADGQLLIGEDWRNRGPKKLLKYLFTHRGQRLSKEKIIDMLWPDWEVGPAVNNLRVTVHALRQALSRGERANGARGRGLGAEVLLQRHGFYYFNTEAPYWSDVDAFTQHVKNGRAAQVRGDRRETIAEYAAAVELYRGEYFPEDIYDDFLTRERERLREQFFVAITELMKLHAEDGNYDAAIDLGRRILREDNTRESVYRRLMRYLALAGRREEALQLYRRARQVLADELGVEPLADTTAVYERIRSGEPP